MNEQTSGQLRQLLQALGAFLTSAGFITMTTAQVNSWVNVAMLVIGVGAQAGGVIWSWKVNRPQELVASVVAMAADPASPVKGVVVEQTIAGRDLQQASRDIAGVAPGAIATAGSPDAKAIAAPAAAGT